MEVDDKKLVDLIARTVDAALGKMAESLRGQNEAFIKAEIASQLHSEVGATLRTKIREEVRSSIFVEVKVKQP